jgi:hypothetical protein
MFRTGPSRQQPLVQTGRLSAASSLPRRPLQKSELWIELSRQRAPEHVAVLEMTGVLWSDWGKPERIVNTLRQIGRQPIFPLECLGRPFAPIPL